VATSHFAIDNSFILHHLEDRFPSALQWRGRLPSPSPDRSDVKPLAGQLVVFTGKLSSLGRKDARALVARLGGASADDVNAKTTVRGTGATSSRAPKS
jgi:NAD-dependent DNA ligase